MFDKRLMMKLVLSTVLVGCAAGAPDEATLGQADEAPVELARSEQALTISELDFPVTLRGTGAATVHATIFTNPSKKATKNVLAVHGFIETGAIFQNISDKLYATSGVKDVVKRVIAIDLVGHGDSSFPTNLPGGARFGELTIGDNVATVIQAIAQLKARNLGPQVIIGHSMGGLEVTAAQEALLAQGSSYAALGIYGAILLAPVPPTGRPWVRPPTGDSTPFIKTTPELGSYLEFPTSVWLGQGFSTFAGTVVPNAPTPAEVETRGYNAIEPLYVASQLVENPQFPLPRPAVRQNAFAPTRGTLLAVVSFSQDTLVPASNLSDLYTYLTGDTRNLGYFPVVANDAVHNMFISNPAGVVNAIKNRF